ncbi:MAG: Holliday junction branch migration protein RuvA [Elusimicrobiota bacterium]
MIAHLRGTLVEKGAERVVLDAGGVGYEVAVSPAAAARLPREGAEASLFIAESVGMYGGGTTLYGFVTREERQMFDSFRGLPNTGAKKALELLEKASRSLPEFRRAIAQGDAKVLTGLFGFTRKTADRLLAGLKDDFPAAVGPSRSAVAPTAGSATGKALEALSNLGYRPPECRAAMEEVHRELEGREAPVEELIRLALRRL